MLCDTPRWPWVTPQVALAVLLVLAGLLYIAQLDTASVDDVRPGSLLLTDASDTHVTFLIYLKR